MSHLDDSRDEIQQSSQWITAARNLSHKKDRRSRPFADSVPPVTWPFALPLRAVNGKILEKSVKMSTFAPSSLGVVRLV